MVEDMAVQSPRSRSGEGGNRSVTRWHGGSHPLYLGGTDPGLAVTGGKWGCWEQGDVEGERDFSCLWWGQ